MKYLSFQPAELPGPGLVCSARRRPLAHSSTVTVTVGAVGPGTTGLSCCRSAVTPLNVAGGGLPVGFLPGLPGASVSPLSLKGWAWGSPHSSLPWGLGGFYMLGAHWLLVPPWASWGVRPAPRRSGSWEQLLQVQAFLGLSPPAVSPLPPLCLVTERFRHCPDLWVPHTEGATRLWVWDAGQSFRAGVPSELPASTSPGGWG